MYQSNIEVIFANEPLGLFPRECAIKPFLKWAGGKSQLISELSRFVPVLFNRYIEPFIGGGAFFFYLNPEQAIISDSNEELIITYKTVRDDVEAVIKILSSFTNDERFFYKIRSQVPDFLSNPERAARLLYLNKTCFNGLYRVNKKGEFNVPYSKRTGEFFNPDDLRNAAEFLAHTLIYTGDYLDVLRANAQQNDFIFLDPPYYPVGKYSDFKRYTKEFFYIEDQVELKLEFDRLVELGCKVLLTNSDHPFILDLYKEYHIEVFETKRLISSNPNTRTGKDIVVFGSK